MYHDFSSKETCSLWADFINKATKLEECLIAWQVGQKKDVEMELATEGEGGKPGFIKMIDRETKEVVLHVETQRTKWKTIYRY